MFSVGIGAVIFPQCSSDGGEAIVYRVDKCRRGAIDAGAPTPAWQTGTRLITSSPV